MKTLYYVASRTWSVSDFYERDLNVFTKNESLMKEFIKQEKTLFNVEYKIYEIYSDNIVTLFNDAYKLHALDLKKECELEVMDECDDSVIASDDMLEEFMYDDGNDPWYSEAFNIFMVYNTLGKISEYFNDKEMIYFIRYIYYRFIYGYLFYNITIMEGVDLTNNPIYVKFKEIGINIPLDDYSINQVSLYKLYRYESSDLNKNRFIYHKGW